MAIGENDERKKKNENSILVLQVNRKRKTTRENGDIGHMCSQRIYEKHNALLSLYAQ